MLLASACGALGQNYTISTIAGGAPPPTPAAGASTPIGAPQRVALDSSGDAYFSASNSVFELTTGGTVILIAGNGRVGYSGDGGPAVNAQLNGPQGVAVDSSGNVYISDSNNNVVRMVTSGGIISTFAGNGTLGYGGDGGLATTAQMHLPIGITVDSSSNVYIADSGNNVIREVSGGVISTIAGNYGLGKGFSGDTGIATGAQLNTPTDVAVDSSGNVYIADLENGNIREVTVSTGDINTVAGSFTEGYAGDGGVATSASLYYPAGVALDHSGNIYISEFGDNRIRMVTVSSGKITTIAGNGTYGYAGDGSSATGAEFALNMGIAVDSSGNVYVADLFNYRVRKISGGNINTIAGNGVINYAGDGGRATAAQLFNPNAVAVDAKGNVYIADTRNNRVREVTANGIINTIAGTGAAGSGGDNGPATSAQLNGPQGLAVDASGNLYIADTANNRVRIISNGTISTFAGNGTAGSSGDGGSAMSAELNGPHGMTFDASGNLYIAEFNGSRVRKVSNGTITTVAGNGISGYAGDGGPAADAELNGPQAVAVDGLGNIYISDLNNAVVRIVSGGTIRTFAGNGTGGYSGDGGPAIAAQLAAPGGIAVDGAGNVFVGDTGTRIRRISPDGNINTIAGSSSAGYTGDGGPALNAEIDGGWGLVLGTSGSLYFADTLNNAVRLLQVSSYGVTIGAVTNGATNETGAIAPGEIVVIYGTGLGPNALATYQPVFGIAGTSLAGTKVLFNGLAAPMVYSWVTQVAAVVPFELTGSTAQVVVESGDQTSAPVTVPVAKVAPALFTINEDGTGQAVALNANGSINSATNAAQSGGTISLLGTGGGVLTPAQLDGQVAIGEVNLAASVSVTIGGQPATVQYAGDAPSFITGVMEITVQIPSGVSGTALPVVVTVGGVSSQAGVTISAHP